LVAENIQSEQTQKTNLEEQSLLDLSEAAQHKKHHKRGKKHHNKHSHHAHVSESPIANSKPEKSLVQTETNNVVKKTVPSSNSLLNTKASNQTLFDKHAQVVDIPIDEVKAITLKVSPTYALDQVESVTLKSFRKVVGYDTFNSILKKDRDEKKDQADHYNVTVSMMVKRVPEATAAAPLVDPYGDKKSLAQTLDKGFPYDDGDSSIDDMVPKWKSPKAPQPATLVGRLNE
jgi:hypothetical protein